MKLTQGYMPMHTVPVPLARHFVVTGETRCPLGARWTVAQATVDDEPDSAWLAVKVLLRGELDRLRAIYSRVMRRMYLSLIPGHS